MKSLFVVLSLIAFIFAACAKNKAECYNRSLARETKNNYCTTDCPGVIGCDGKTYCNACEANKQGIRVK